MLLAALCACFWAPPVSVAADQALGDRWAKGTVRAGETVYLYAPMGGQLEAFDLSVGDDIRQDDVLMQVRPADVPAPFGGVIRVQHAHIGDIAENVIKEYGALCYLERTDVHWLKTSAATAYDDAANRDIRVGETLRVYNNKTGVNDKKEAPGRVVAVNGSDFTVEFPAGIFNIEESIRVYRGAGSEYKDTDRVGRGKAQRVPPIAVAAQGVIAGILVEEGQTVDRGQPLYVLDAADTRYETAAQPEVTALEDCVLTALYVQPGQYVAKGQLLLTAAPLHALECAVDVDELDILTLSVGMIVRVRLDAKPDRLLAATVERIAPLGKKMLDTTKYEVTLRLAGDDGLLLPAMHVTAYW